MLRVHGDVAALGLRAQATEMTFHSHQRTTVMKIQTCGSQSTNSTLRQSHSSHNLKLPLRNPLMRLSDPVPILRDSRVFHASSPSEDGPLLTHSSLPPTPIPSSPPPSTSNAERAERYRLLQKQSDVYTPPFYLWDYLREELLATGFDSHQELKWVRVSGFLSILVAVEKIVLFGFILCFDSFLYTFTVQPIRFALVLW
ncbi:hypothetical protein BGY98DRAFT_683716 [Russula aff. rugulosa BPL654]|nr:hypothetical protein BGY98DRAFT_683716 [Russula aff. rugulosa BPL654]